MRRVLVIEDEPRLRDGLCRALSGAGYEPIAARGVREARLALERGDIACALLDVRLEDGDGLALLAELRGGVAPALPVVIVSALDDGPRTIEAMRLGAFDFVTKPFDLPALLAVVSRAIEASQQASSPPEDAGERLGLIGSSAPMREVWKAVGRAASSDAAVLVTGETGTGKEVVARAIHAYSRRSSGPFVAVNLSAVPAALVESELFGHERGAFTGAHQRRRGRIEAAAGGVLFLDEIGDLEPALQTRLLRVLAGESFERVGGSDPLTLEARVIAATHRPVTPGAPGAALREDLYYRLAVVVIELPPVRERAGDVPRLVHAAARRAGARVTDEALALLAAYDWPGNVRELLHVVERAAVMSASRVIDADALPEAIRSRTSTPRPLADLDLRRATATLEKRLIREALARSGGNRAEAARLLGIGRTLLYAKLAEHEIE